MSIELKPCPFCGGEAVFVHGNTDVTADRGRAIFNFTIKCHKCGAYLPNTCGSAYVYMKKNGDFDIIRADMEKAAEAWNGRAE